jgi:hypothetical protein
MPSHIDFNHFQLGGVNDKGNKFVAPCNQNFQFFTNDMPSHSTNFLQDFDVKNDEMSIDTTNNMNNYYTNNGWFCRYATS